MSYVLERIDAPATAYDASLLADLPLYGVPDTGAATAVESLLAAARRANALVVVSPGYHGGMSGMIKNALDHLEGLRDDPTPYLAGRAMGCIAVAEGPQAAVGTLQTLRATAHALRAWPTPMGVAICEDLSVDSGRLSPPPAVGRKLEALAGEVDEFMDRYVP
jgi:FMN reductase